MLIIILGLALGLLNFVNFGFCGLGEILFLIILFYSGILKRHKKIPIYKTSYMYMIFFIIYITMYFVISDINYSYIIKAFFKWIILFIESICIFSCLNKNSKTTIKFTISFLITSIFTQYPYINSKWFFHYVVILPAIILLCIYKNNKKYEMFLYAICLFYAVVGQSRTTLVLLIAFILYKVFFNIIKSENIRKQNKFIKNTILLCIFIVIIVGGFLYISKNVSTNTESNNERSYLIEIAIKEFKSNVVVGVGPGNYNNYAQQKLGYYLRDDNLTSHNIYLQILSENGILGFLIFLKILIPNLRMLFNKKINLYTNFINIYLLIYYFFNTFTGMNRFVFAIFIGSSMYYYLEDNKNN